jgi:S1-C subfamily serine protease
MSTLGAVLAVKLTPPKHSVTLPDSRYSAPAISGAVVKTVQDFTVLISNEDMGSISRGTGILLSSTTVLTCAHVLGDDHSAKNMWIYPYPGAQVVRAKVKFVNLPNDLALLTLETPVLGHKTPTIATEVRTGEPIVVVGNIKGFMVWFVSYGIISGEHDRWVLTDATIRGGNSGGPWTNAKGEIVALTDVGWSDSNDREIGVSGGVPAKDLLKFLAESKLKKPDLLYAITGD